MAEKINPSAAFYIKLGAGGVRESECLNEPGLLWVDWREVPHELCIKGDWEKVRELELAEYHGNEIVATTQVNQLKTFYEGSEDVLWMTFSRNHLFWCLAGKTVTPHLKDRSRSRPTIRGWSHQDISGNDLDVSRLSGSLLAVQGYRSAICKVKEFEYLVRKINGESSPAEKKANEARQALIVALTKIIQQLHWKEFELLVDLIFRQAGWQRLSQLGKTQKGLDLDLVSPINHERYYVQVKSAAGLAEFNAFQKGSSGNPEYARYYFIVHTPGTGLTRASETDLAKLWLPEDIARLAVNYGLTDWLIGKAK